MPCATIAFVVFQSLRGRCAAAALALFAPVAGFAASPVLQYLTYLGGNGVDRIGAAASDSAGNLVIAGYTTSTNFPGTQAALPAGASIFVSKINSSGSALLFTTILGTDAVSNSSAVNGNFDSVSSAAVDNDDAIYVAGTTSAANFPVSANAWSKGPRASFVVKLDISGRLLYATYLPFSMRPTRIQVRNGIAYVAGTFNDATFLGTQGAVQRDLAGPGDIFVLALAADGSGPKYLTAFGGSGNEVVSDMVLDAAGNVILAGYSTSLNYPLSGDAAFRTPPTNGQAQAIVTRLDATLSRVIYSSWMPLPQIFGLASTGDGNYVIAGSGALPESFTAGGANNSIALGSGRLSTFIAKISAASNRPLWTTAVQTTSGTAKGITADSQDNLIWVDFVTAIGGGSIVPSGGPALYELSADGSRMLYSSVLPATSGLVAASPGGSVMVAGYTNVTNIPATPGVVQPARDPASPGTFNNVQNGDDGYAAKLDLSSFSVGDYFLSGNPLAITWRIGEPLPAPATQTVQFGGSAPAALTVTPSSRITAAFVPAGDTSSVAVNVDTSQTVAGTFQESVALQIAGRPATAAVLPVSLTIKPAVSFDVSTNQVSIHIRQGQDLVPAKIDITPHFGNEFFNFTTASTDPSWLFPGFVQSSNGGLYQLSINVGLKPPGVYNGTITVGLSGLQSVTRTIAVTYTVDPAVPIQLSPTFLEMHVIKGQPFQPVTVNVTSSVPGVKFSVFTGTRFGWINVTQTSQVTPAQIVFTADTSDKGITPSYTEWKVFVTGEDQKQLFITYDIDVSSGAPFDLAPESIDIQWTRGTSPPAAPFVSMTTASPGNVSWSADQPWVFPHSDSGPTPYGTYIQFDSTMPEGIYHATLTATAAGVTKTLPITWRLFDPPRLAYSVTQLTFHCQAGGPAPPAQQITITTPTIQQAFVSVGFSTPLGFLKVDPTFGTTPLTISVSLDPTGVTVGTHTYSLTIFSQFPGGGRPVEIPITLIVDADPNAPTATVSRVADAATYLPGSISPGEILVIFGSGLGPPTLVQSQVSGGRYPTTLAGTTVYFDSTPAPILYASTTQLAVAAPFGIAGRTNLTIDLSGKRTAPIALSVDAAAPGIFTANASGSGLAAALNVAADGGITVHGANAPVARGGVLTLYTTGLGATTPLLGDGVLAGAPLPTLNTAVRVLVGGQQAQVLYSGPAPGLIAGVGQINIRVPANAPVGLVPMLIVSGDAASQPGVTINVQ